MAQLRKAIKICLVGGGSQAWAPLLIRDIIFKPGMEHVRMDLTLLDLSVERARAVETLFRTRLKEWKNHRATVHSVRDPKRAIAGADFIIFTISTGRLEAMAHDLAIPEKYGIYHTVGDTVGPGGWSRALRNIPVFQQYAELIRRLAPGACVLNYTNPMGALTKVLADALGHERVVGLCHGLFENYEILQRIFGVEREEDIRMRIGGLNHFFWMLDFQVNGRPGYTLLRRKLRGRRLSDLIGDVRSDSMGWKSNKDFASELFETYGYLPYLGDRHTCEFFASTMRSEAELARLNIHRTTIAERRAAYRKAARRIALWQCGRRADLGPFTRTPSRETAADIIKAVTLNESFCDVVNMVNVGQIDNMPRGVVVETLGHVSGNGSTPFTVGPMPGRLLPLLLPHAHTQLRTVEAGLSGDAQGALQALEADPVCSALPSGVVRKMGLELLRANRSFLSQSSRVSR